MTLILISFAFSKNFASFLFSYFRFSMCQSQVKCFPIILCLWSVFSVYADKTPLYMAGVLELSDLPEWFAFPPVVVKIVNNTLNDINNKTNLLEDFNLQMVTRDMGVSISRVFCATWLKNNSFIELDICFVTVLLLLILFPKPCTDNRRTDVLLNLLDDPWLQL